MYVFRVFGSLGVRGARITAARQRIVLAMLLLEAGRPVHPSRLIDAVWEDAPPSTAKAQIQICISTLRRALADAGLPGRIVTGPAGYQIATAPGELDLQVFNDLLADGRAAVRDQRPADAVLAYRRAVALSQNPPLSGVESRVIEAAAARLAERRISAVEEFFEVQLSLGRHDDIVDELTVLAAEHPLRERLWRQLITALYRAGRRAEALAAYRSARQASVDGLGLEPSRSLRLLERIVLNGDSMPGPPVHPAPAAVADPDVSVPRMTPADIPDFTGHAALIHRLRDALCGRDAAPEGGSAPVVIVTGRGGIGKTTLAVHLAHQLAEHFPDGQLFARLGDGGSTGAVVVQVLERFLRALGVPGPAIPDDLEARAAMFRSVVARRRVLVILDDAAGEHQVQALLPASPESGVIVTSRRRLAGIPGSRLVDIGAFSPADGLELLAKTMGRQRVDAEPAEARRLVEQCGRLPLALRIAAYRLNARPHWRIAQLVERLTDDSRMLDELVHGGMGVRASIAPSYRGVGRSAQRLLSRLSILESADFPGRVAAPLLEEDPATAAEALDALVDARLVDVVALPGAEPRYRLHELVKAYARELLVSDEESAARIGALKRRLSA
ncbi:AfsR/SARP family transcriptional regulator [Catenuloplanes atrovinosus]|uniref:DNA-binding SARP family transcriptional activator n=1 Tax=Catenuloplanes atrovinosus TaxID=137266 RepID=A0AAE4CAS1_9ACTN|nr:BTAD domain-containing putative transcriptional regulator [Catenuloplanes atrovinosus]MDR7274875.1 DNA-binding SARP family transcriptional activator [Catenuloplanes atrovinosus]